MIFLKLFTFAISLSIAFGHYRHNKIYPERKPLHPLDPLRAQEISTTKNIINKASKPFGTRGPYFFNLISLVEPPKSVLLSYFLYDSNPPLDVYPRKSSTLMYDQRTFKSYEVIVNLNSLTIESFKKAPSNVLVSFLSIDDMNKIEGVILADPQVQLRCSQLGYPNMSLVQADIWPLGYFGDKNEKYPNYRPEALLQIFLYGKSFQNDNYQAHPLDFILIYDHISGKVVEFEDLPIDENNNVGSAYDQKNLVPKNNTNYDHQFRSNDFLRKDVKPIIVDSPEGTSYKVNGNEIQWQKFKFRIGFNGREGVVLHMVSYNDSGNIRPILYRASLSEMFVPYGDPRPPFQRRGVYDEGELGLGISATSLKHYADCTGKATFFDGVLNNSTGDPIVYKRVICVTEEDAGILWRHTDRGKTVSVRSHRLLLTFTATVGNYDYVFNWYFHQDGSIQHQVQMTGMLSINILSKHATSGGYGTIVFPQINAQYHQHFFSVRLDTEIDGNQNSVHSSELQMLENGLNNPYGQGFTVNQTLLKTSSQARTFFSAKNDRIWIVSNPNKMNPINGQPVGWKLVPMNTPALLMKKDSPVRVKAAFLDYDVWVTPYKEGQLFAGGCYLNNSGLPEWVRNDPEANLKNTDVVLWHNFGMTHFPRVEDFPVMPVEIVGFWLKPLNFFSENPSLDVPPAEV